MKKHWCFTSFQESPLFTTWTEDTLPSYVKYIIYQRERCPDSERLHWQGYIELSRSQRMSKLKRIFNDNTIHLEGRNGSRESARDYCQKEESRLPECEPVELGTWTESNQGKRTDLEFACEILKTQGISAVAEELPGTYVKFSRGLEKLSYILRRSPEWRELRVIVLVGTAGTGKTRCARSCFGPTFLVPPPTGNRIWWDGYNGEETLIIDEFYGWLKYSHLLRILDGHPLQLEIKGGMCWALWNTVILTSNKHPSEWYDQGLTPALARRIRQTIVLTNNLEFDENGNLLSDIQFN